MIIFDDLKRESKELNVPIWKLPDFFLIISAVINIVTMLITYWWLSNWAEDPREAVPFVAIEAVLITIIGNIVVESAKRIISVNQLKKEFVDIISHQLRSPLATIKWYMEMMSKTNTEKFTAKQKEYMGVVVDANGKMLNLINDLLNMANIEKGDAKYNFEELDFIQIIHETINNHKIYMQSKKMKLTFKKPKIREVTVWADRMKLKVIIENLITNAIKYTPQGGTIDVNLNKKGDNIICQIKDNGLGIRDNDKALIFEKFYRGRVTRNTEINGTGLGLYICKVLVNGMNGQIWFKSKYGQGSSFFVSLPYIY